MYIINIKAKRKLQWNFCAFWLQISSCVYDAKKLQGVIKRIPQLLTMLLLFVISFKFLFLLVRPKLVTEISKKTSEILSLIESEHEWLMPRVTIDNNEEPGLFCSSIAEDRVNKTIQFPPKYSKDDKTSTNSLSLMRKCLSLALKGNASPFFHHKSPPQVEYYLPGAIHLAGPVISRRANSVGSNFSL